MAEELYGASPEEFVERRTQQVAEARAAGDRALARAIGQLRRPTRSAWMVNLLARQTADEVGQLLDLGAALFEAQQRASGPDLRRLSSLRSAALDALTRRATDLAAAAGHRATDTSRQEVSQTLQAALAEPSVADLVRAGRVTQPVTYGGFGPLGLLAAASEPAASPAPVAERVEEGRAAGNHARLEAEAAVAETSAALDAAEGAAAAAGQAAEEATRHANDLAEEVETLHAQLQEATAKEEDARQSARAARRQLQQRQQAVTDAQHRLVQARQALLDLTAGCQP